MSAKTKEQRAIEKQMRAQKKAERDTDIRVQASALVAGAHMENGLRIMDSESESLLQEILKQYNGNLDNQVRFHSEEIQTSLSENLPVLYKSLQMYGMLASIDSYGNEAMLIITESAKKYFHKKEIALEDNEIVEKPVKIFISHSSDDKDYVKRIVELLEDMKVLENGIFCSSIPEYGIPGGMKIFDFIREQFEHYALHMIFVLSDNYYNSIASMNEMGAAWVGRNEYTVLLLPGYPYSGIKGVLDPGQIATKLDDDDTINARLSEFRDKVLSEFNLQKINENRWERIRDSFICDIKLIDKI